MATPIFAGFEGAKLHWNGLDVLAQTGHADPQQAGRNAAEAIIMGAKGIRDTLPERLNCGERYAAIRKAIGRNPVVWSAVHFDQPATPLLHARQIAPLMTRDDRLIPFNEPSIGRDVSGYTKAQAIAIATAIGSTALAVNPWVRLWTCDTAHFLGDETWEATDALVGVFGQAIEVVGINYHAAEACHSLHLILREAAARYPGHKIAITETSWHDGHEKAQNTFPDIRGRQDWLRHVRREVDYSGVPVVCITWAPRLDMAWRPNETWPNGWPTNGGIS